MSDLFSNGNEKMRIVQELVPGRQVTLAHIIASPDPVIYQKLGMNPLDVSTRAAIGILSMTPAEITVIAGDLATKHGNIELSFIDRFSGALMFTGLVADVEAAMQAIMDYLAGTLQFTLCPITKT